MRQVTSGGDDVLYLAVLPFYRQECVRELLGASQGSVRLFAGSHHIDSSVRSGIDRSLYTPVANYVVGGRVLLQLGHIVTALRAESVIVDLNPRSVTAWFLLIVRRLLRKRTLVWGHLHPRKGAGSRTAFLRRAMRRLAQGTVLYGYDSVPPARAEVPRSPVWVAPNSLYSRSQLRIDQNDGPYDKVLYVGRLVPEKKVDLLIEAFALSKARHSGNRLVIVGEGSASRSLQRLAEELGVHDVVDFLGPITASGELRAIYRNALCSVSPGYLGLSATQTLGFGVPMVASRDEPHAPEVELARFGGITFFETDNALSLAACIDSFDRKGCGSERISLGAQVAEYYSAEAMASGLLKALKGEEQDFGVDGWPRIA